MLVCCFCRVAVLLLCCSCCPCVGFDVLLLCYVVDDTWIWCCIIGLLFCGCVVVLLCWCCVDVWLCCCCVFVVELVVVDGVLLPCWLVILLFWVGSLCCFVM